MIYKERKDCRICGGEFKDVLSLGNQCISAFVDSDVKPIKAPLDLVTCKDCNTLQLKHTTAPHILYTNNYSYRSGINQSMRDELLSIYQDIMGIIDLRPNDVVVDIGSSDATLLNYFPDFITKVGYEPIEKFKKYHKNAHFINDFFNSRKYKFPKAKVITAIAMFYDLEDPNAFMEDIDKVLDDDGIFVSQQNFLPKMLTEGTFDNISHEHLAYYDLTTFQNLLDKHGFDIFRVTQTPINGGCFRVFAKKKTNIEDFARRTEENARKLHEFVSNEVSNGKVVYVYGASTRGNVILQKANLDHKLITAAAERNPEKWGKKTLGTNIPIVSEKEAREAKPDYFLALPYFFRDEFIKREEEFLKRGGKFIFPLPELEIYEG